MHLVSDINGKAVIDPFCKGEIKSLPTGLAHPPHIAAYTTGLTTMRHISLISLIAFACVGFAAIDAEAASLPALPTFTVPTAPAFTVPTKPVVVAAPKPMSASAFLTLTKKH